MNLPDPALICDGIPYYSHAQVQALLAAERRRVIEALQNAHRKEVAPTLLTTVR